MIQDGITAHMRSEILIAPIILTGPVIPNFGLTPIKINNNIIDYTTKKEIRLYKKITKLLYKNKKDYFDLINKIFYPFMIRL